MKRYLAFVGLYNHINDDMDDFIGDFDNKEDAIIAINDACDNEKHSYESYWGHIQDTLELKIVYFKN